ncbi:MAG: FkbM family methyltransferase [Microcoleaceae cyanobacterium]
MKLDLHALCQKHRIMPRGVIHVGSYDGQDIKRYPIPEAAEILIVEANPTVAQQLQTHFARTSSIRVVNFAISDHSNTATLYIPAIESNSSILPFTGYQDIYPNLKETRQITVESHTLSTLLAELHLDPANFNLLYLNIQGAELLALQGASQLLKQIEAIYTTISYQELFEGGALIDQVDAFLEQYHFRRVAQANPYHPAWGEVFYVYQSTDSLGIAHTSQSTQIQKLQEELDQLQSQFQHVQTERDQLQSQFQHVQAERDQLQSQFQHVQAERDQLQSQFQHVQTERDQLQSQFQHVQAEQDQLQSQFQHVQTERDQTFSELHQAREELEITQFQLDEIQIELDHSQSRLHQVQAELEQVQVQLHQTQAELTIQGKDDARTDCSEHVRTLARILAETLETRDQVS